MTDLKLIEKPSCEYKAVLDPPHPRIQDFVVYIMNNYKTRHGKLDIISPDGNDTVSVAYSNGVCIPHEPITPLTDSRIDSVDAINKDDALDFKITLMRG